MKTKTTKKKNEQKDQVDLKQTVLDINEMEIDEIVDYLSYVRGQHILENGCIHCYSQLMEQDISQDEWFEFIRYSHRIDNNEEMSIRMTDFWNKWQDEKEHWDLDFESKGSNTKSNPNETT
jgi:hypothetical protein